MPDPFNTFAPTTVNNSAAIYGELHYTASSSSPEPKQICFAGDPSDCAKRIVGEYAIVLTDRAKLELVAIRDRIGCRPFYYLTAQRKLLFSTDLNWLARHPLHRPKPNREFLLCELLGDYSALEQTRYQAIKRLPPGHLLIANPAGVRVRRYWDVPEDLDSTMSYSAAVDQLRALFCAAVAQRLDRERPVCVSFSGGFDSTAIACAAQELDRIPINLLFPSSVAGPQREPVSLEALDRRDFVFSEVDFSGANALLAPLAEREGSEIDWHPTFFMFRPLLEHAQRLGARRLLVGFGGDDVFSLPDSVAFDLLKRGHPLRALRYLRLLSSLGEALGPALWRGLLRPALPGSLVTAIRKFRPAIPPPWIDSGTVRTTAVYEKIAARHRDKLRIRSSRAHQELYLRLCAGGGTAQGFEQTDLMGTYSGMRFSAPLFDSRLIDFAFRTPVSHLCNGTRMKPLLRDALRGLMPDSIRARESTQDFRPWIVQVIDRHEPEINQLFISPRLADLGIVDPGGIAEAWRHGRSRGSFNPLLLIYSIERWLRSLE